VSEGALAGRRVLVVGAGTQPSADPEAPIGNGRAISILAARQGATVICADRDQAAATETARLVEAEGGSAEVLTADVADEAECQAMVAAAAEPGLNGLVLNVGTARGRDLGETSAKDWDLVLNVNLRSHFICAREALPHMGQDDAMVFIGSTAGLRPGSRLPAYDASKAGLVGLCRHTAREGARKGVRANLVAPGLIDTPLGRLASAGRPSRQRTPIPLGRQGTAWEVAETVVFLLSRASSYITGVVLPVDGGLALL
jgi:NAD(P)-dependent dehydrogenase (short-subunit alcohol dehydrogenase family)